MPSPATIRGLAAIAVFGLGLEAGSCRTGGAAAAASRPAGRRPDVSHSSEAQRRDALRRAQVWRPVDTARLDLRAGPDVPGRFAPGASVTCDYFDDGRPRTGMTPKFLCKAGDDVLKVKYGEGNGEVYAETAASRLFWALGFGADAVYPVEVTCRDCPVDPWLWRTSLRHEARVYAPATIERKFPGEAIATGGDDTGWSWAELDEIDAGAGGAPVAHRDALKLLAVFVQHGDNKASQQRLVCLPGGVRRTADGARCDRPFLVVSDLGATFGGAGDLSRGAKAKMRFRQWASKHVFKAGPGCVGDLDGSLIGTLQDPKIGEAGRRFLAERLGRLRDAQIRDLFAVAGADQRGETIEEGGVERAVTLDDWVEVFQRKRREISERRCPD